jgi:lactoylglutathione lyase
MNRDDFPAPKDGFVLTHFLVVADQDRSRDFHQRLFDGQVVVVVVVVVVQRDPIIIEVGQTTDMLA